MKKKRIFLLVANSAILLLLFVGCSRATENDLQDTSWTVTKINGQDPINGTTLTLEFREDKVAGRAGCNHFEGNYSIENGTIQFKSVFNTEMACPEPQGVMTQEQIFLDILRSADHYDLVASAFILYDNNGASIHFVSDADATAQANISISNEQDPDKDDVSTENPPEEPQINLEPSWVHNLYQDPETGIMIFIPKTWIVTGIIEGDIAVLQSYPEDKYVGGEVFDAGDTKCDLNIHAGGVTKDQLVEQWESSPMSTILSEDALMLNSGQQAWRYEIENRGHSITFITDLNGRVVTLTCFGDFSFVNDIASTLHADE